MATAVPHPAKPRVPAAERRDALIDAAIEEFSLGGMHGTPVDRIARRVGVAQPYVFSLFGSKRDLFLAAVQRGFRITGATFEAAVAAIPAGEPNRGEHALRAMAAAYYPLIDSRRALLMLQLHAYAACDDPVIREHVSAAYARMVNLVTAASGADAEEVDNFMRYGMWLNVGAAMGVQDLSAGCDWVIETE